jgi:hypothetical protein
VPAVFRKIGGHFQKYLLPFRSQSASSEQRKRKLLSPSVEGNGYGDTEYVGLGKGFDRRQLLGFDWALFNNCIRPSFYKQLCQSASGSQRIRFDMSTNARSAIIVHQIGAHAPSTAHSDSSSQPAETTETAFQIERADSGNDDDEDAA